MNRTRSLIVSLAVGVAAVAGVFALGHTLALGAQSHATTDKQVAVRTAQLNRYEASLRKELAQKPPVLPPVPKAGTAGTASVIANAPATTAGTVTSAAPVRVVYHRPPPIVVVKHRAGGEHETETQGAGADD
jgi:hypothetical protein